MKALLCNRFNSKLNALILFLLGLVFCTPALSEELLLWLVLEKEGVKQLVGSDAGAEIGVEIEALAKRMGVSLLYPLYDATDSDIISEKDISNRDETAIIRASERYEPKAILAGGVQGNIGKWMGSWVYIQDGKALRWESTASTLPEMIKEVLTGLGRPANKSITAGNGNVLITIMGNFNENQYSKITEYLRKLPSVSEVEVAEITPDKTTFDLLTSSSASALKQAIAADKVLVQNDEMQMSSGDGMNASASGSELIYRFVE